MAATSILFLYLLFILVLVITFDSDLKKYFFILFFKVKLFVLFY